MKFEAAFVDNNAIDLSIALDLTEIVTAVARPGGGHDVLHWAEPDTDAVLDGRLPGAPVPAPLLQQVFIDGEVQALIP
jgi:hypothetical protein